LSRQRASRKRLPNIDASGGVVEKAARCGSWRSPITSNLIAGNSTTLTEVCLDGNSTYWLESRPYESGRSVVVRRAAGGSCADVTPAPFNVRTRAHEYGGGAWTVSDGTLYFSNDADRRLYRLNQGAATPVPFTPPSDYRYADGVMDRRRNLWIGIREDHTQSTEEPVNSIVAISPDAACPSAGRTLISGRDFYSSPRLSPHGNSLAWLAWDHPNMPWVGTTLYHAGLDEHGALSSEIVAIAGAKAESVFQPEWSPDGAYLYFVSDRSGWWNLYRYDLKEGAIQALAPLSAEFGQPQWQFGMSCYGFAGANCIVCAYIQKGRGKLALLDTVSLRLTEVESSFSDFWWLRVDQSRAVFRAGAPARSTCIAELDLESKQFSILRESMPDDPGIVKYLSKVQQIEFPTDDRRTAYGHYYPASNPDYSPIPAEKPPLLVRCHGGPTAEAPRSLDLRIHYWTSRGIAVLDVNYGGSTGFGREYRQRLHRKWGVVDIADCINGAKFLAEQGLVDANRMVITGNSAGGYAALLALAQSDVFSGGASHYGVTEAAQFVHQTHKFESHYLDWLIGPFPEQDVLYRERSPMTHAAKLSSPVIFFAGEEDMVVPVGQTLQMVEALRRQGTTVGCFIFAAEQHGFRSAETIKRALDAELYFYAMNVFGVDLSF
jgi:dipeptidyl aminopeptidase/acylaminoacyl peptidase